ncbi:MAG: transcriptional repressor LexA [Candidatus Goldbacteria bacterium]|nr:transcriptional repressor LexA [Candidatus Goldiibacteriota bacterium]
MKLKDRTKKMLDIIQRWFQAYNYPPTLRELAKESGLKSTWTVRYHLKKLVEHGLINMRKNISRGIELARGYGIPIIGKISAGQPIEAIENIDKYINSIYDLFGKKDIFGLRIKGDSMIGAGIFDGDIVIVKKQATAENGEIVAVLIENEATVKRFYKDKNHIKLVAENPKYEPIISKNAQIIGKVVGLIRKDM